MNKLKYRKKSIMSKRNLVTAAVSVLLFVGCSTKSDTLKVNYIREGVLCSEVISLDFIGDDNKIHSPYIDSVGFCYLDSLSYPGNNPDRYETHITPYKLNFSKKIEPCSPEYYTAYTVYHIIKVIEYYNRLFDNKIDFNAQETYRTVEVAFGDASMLTHPNFYIFEENSNPSPTLFSHETGHRAFWYLEDRAGIKFNGLSLVHMGLLEYFTVSLYDTPLVGEDCLPAKTVRDASILHKYPIDSTYNLRHTFKLLEESYPEELQNPESNISKYLSASYAYYGSDVLDKYYDNHRGAMILTGTLWRIREQMGREDTDKLIAQTIMNLNVYMDKRNDFYTSDINSLPDKIDWCDVFYGLIQKDKELYDGKNIQTIATEFTKTGYPVDLIKY
jgi:hypothetical protein